MDAHDFRETTERRFREMLQACDPPREPTVEEQSALDAAQEIFEEYLSQGDVNVPMGPCPGCGIPLYTSLGFCSNCGDRRPITVR